MAWASGEAMGAESLFRESLALYTEIGERRNGALALSHVGKALSMQGAYTEARNCFLDSLTMDREVKAVPAILDTLVGLAGVQAKEGAMEQALELLTHILSH